MFNFITRIVTKHPVLVVVVMFALMLAAGAIGNSVTTKLSTGGFEYSGAESYQASQRLSNTFGQKDSNILLLITAKSGTVDSEAVVAAAAEIENKLKSTKNISSVSSYWSAGKPSALKSTDGTQAIIIANIDGTSSQVADRIKPFTQTFTTQNSTIKVAVGGVAAIDAQFSSQIEKDLFLAEMIALPLTLLLLVFIFRSLIAACLPVILGVFAIMGSLFVLWVISHFTTVSIYALNLTTMLGLGLAIDYSLFMVARFREQLEQGDSVNEAVGHAVGRAGRMIFFSGVTVAISLAALVIFPQNFLRSFAFAGVAVALVAAIGSIFLLPAILKLLGHRINSISFGMKPPARGESRFWIKVGNFVTRHPLIVLGVVLETLAILALPFMSINLGRGDETSLPKTNPVRLVHQDIRHNFTSKETSALYAVSTSTTNVNPANIDTYAAKLSQLKNVDHVEASTGIYVDGQLVGPVYQAGLYQPNNGTFVRIIPSIEPISTDGENLTRDIRSVSAPFTVQVGGLAPQLTDMKDSIYKSLPWVLLFIGVTTYILLFLMFGGVLLPLITIGINLFSLSAVFGIVVWIFQQGHLTGLLNFTANGMIESSMPVLIFCIAFGLSMDYSVFLLARIKEQYDATGNTTDAIIHGLGKTGGIITAAAVCISIVFLAFGTSGVMVIKLFGLGLSVAVLLDAFVIRGTLVPAAMQIAGRANWWSPRFMKRIYRHFGINE